MNHGQEDKGHSLAAQTTIGRYPRRLVILMQDKQERPSWPEQ